MAWFLSAVFSCDKASGKMMMELMGRTRPDFPEDVPSQWEEFYGQLDGLDYPSNMILKKNLLYVEWHDDESQLKDIEALAKFSPQPVQLKVVYYVPDDPMSGDEEDEEDEAVLGYVFAMRNGQLEKVPTPEIEMCLSGRRSVIVSERNSDKLLFILASSL